MGTLSSRCRTHINHIIILFRCRSFRNQHGADILYIKQPFFKTFQSRQIIQPGYFKSIRQFRNRMYCHPFCFQFVYEFFRCHSGKIGTDRQPVFCGKSLQNLTGLFLSIIFGPYVHDPFRHRICNAQIREANFSPSSCHTTQHTVDKSAQTGKPTLSRQLYRLIAHCGIRHTVHIHNLINAHAHKIADERFHFLYSGFGKLIDHIVQCQLSFQRSFHQARQKSAFLFSQILIFIEHIAEDQMTVLSLLIDRQKHFQHQCSLIDLSRHDFFLQTVKRFEAAAESQLLHLPHT